MAKNSFINTSKPVNVILMGVGQDEHARGEIAGHILNDAHLLERNKRHYYFERISGPDVIFRECQVPYCITEF